MKTRQKLCLNLSGEMYMFNLNDIMFFEADDHYTVIRSSFGNKILVPFNLGSIEKKIKENFPWAVHLMRLGRKFIINTKCIYHINASKQTISLADYYGKTLTLNVSKPVLRNLMDDMKSAAGYTLDVNERNGMMPPEISLEEDEELA